MLIKNLLVGGGAAALLLGLAFNSMSSDSLASKGTSKAQKSPVVTEASATKSKSTKESPFPKRKDYPKLSYITIEDFADLREDAIVIDARNSVEFDVIQIVGAINLSSSTMKRKDLLKIRAADGEQPIVFYCNGPACSKSYKGGEKARSFGFENVFVFDGGVLKWAEVHPDKTLFFGKQMDKHSSDRGLIPKEVFEKSCLDTQAFIDAANSGKYKLYDLRDRDERSKEPIKLPGLIKCNMDKLVMFLNKPGAVPKTHILILDGGGKQIKWIQYYLEEKGHTEYYFLKGGIKQWVKDGYDKSGKKE